MRKVPSSRPDLPGRPRSAEFVLGRERFGQISAVEGIALTSDMRAMLDLFDRVGLSAAERRQAIIKRFSPGG